MTTMRIRFVLPCVLLAAGCQAIVESLVAVQMDYYEKLQGVSSALAEVSPREVWEQPVDGFDVVSITPVGSSIAVYQTRTLEGSFAMQRSCNGELIAVDTSTGAKKWSRALEPDPDIDYAVFAVSSRILLLRSTDVATSLRALEAETGDECWQVELSAGAGVGFSPDGSCALVSTIGDGAELSCLGVDDGQPRWAHPRGDGRSAGLEVSATEVFLLDQGVRCFALDTGETRWRSTFGDGGEDIEVDPVADGFLMFTASGRCRFVDRAGEEVWAVEHDVEPFLGQSSGGFLFLLGRLADGEGRLSCLDPRTGAARWSRTVPKLPDSLPRPFSLVEVHEGRVFYTLERSLEVLDVDTGETLASVGLPAAASAGRLSDRLVARPRGLVVASEAFVAALDLDALAWSWHHEVQGAGAFSNHTLQVEAGLARSSTAESSEPEPVAGGVNPGSTWTYPAADSSYLTWARSNYQSTRSDSSATSQDRINAGRTYESALSNQRAAERAAISAGMLSAAQDVIASLPGKVRVMAAHNRRQIRTYKGEVAMLRADLQPRGHLQSLQGDWFCRPFVTPDAVGLFVVDTTTGKWAEVVLAPNEGDLRYWFVGVPLPWIDLERGLLLSHGVTLDTKKWRRDDRFTVFTCAGRSLLAFDLEAIELYGSDLYPEYSLTSVASDD